MELNDTYQKALDGTLRSVARGDEGTLVITNDTPVRLDIFWIDDLGDHAGYNARTKLWEAGYPGTGLDPGGGQMMVTTWPGQYWLARVSLSGAFVAVVEMTDRARQLTTLSGAHLLDPNDIGDVPMPGGAVVIPPDGPRVLVGAGRLPNLNTVTREQFWQRQPESYSLAPGQTKTVNYTASSGMQDSSSTSDTVAKSVGASLSAGWGPVSASVSASLSTTSTTSQQVTTTTQTTSFVSNEYKNLTDDPEMMLFWQLVDVVTVFDPKGTSLSSIVSGTQPVVVSGPWNIDDFLSTPKRPKERKAPKGAAGGETWPRPTLESIEPAPDDTSAEPAPGDSSA
ncbi:hypothetical protein AB0I16_11890 [Streptomyces sp. NPDC050703]|uniref:hypothetical protein n=1 Tax=Streptomyces sp. NPDC050703 TaxID=3157218 RepID=UPI00341D153B